MYIRIECHVLREVVHVGSRRNFKLKPPSVFLELKLLHYDRRLSNLNDIRVIWELTVLMFSAIGSNINRDRDLHASEIHVIMPFR